MVRPHEGGRRETIGLLPGDRSFDRRWKSACLSGPSAPRQELRGFRL